MTIGEQIKKLRTDYGLTQKEFGDRVGVAAPHLSDIEKGKVVPNGRLIEGIADAFGLEFGFIDRTAGLASDIPPALAEFAQEAGLSRADTRMLSVLHLPGKACPSKEGWRFLWDAIRLVCGGLGE